MGREVEIDRLVMEEGVVAEGDCCEEAGDEELVVVVLPPVGDPGREREDRNGCQEEHEGERRGRRRSGGMNAVVVSRRRGGRSFVRLVGDLLMGRFGALGRHDPVATPLRPADDTGQAVERQQAEQEPHHWGAGSAGLIRWRRGVGVGSGAVWLVHRCST